MDVFAEQTDKIIRFLADADLINEMNGKTLSSIINIASQLNYTLTSFNDNPREKPTSQPPNPLLQVYVDRYYNELSRRREAGIDPVRIELFEVEGVGGEVTEDGLPCDVNGCYKWGNVCQCRLLDPPMGKAFGKCVPESCGITFWTDVLKHRYTSIPGQ
jgi:hypothetical protein